MLGFKFTFVEEQKVCVELGTFKAVAIRTANSAGFASVFNTLIFINTVRCLLSYL